MTKITDDALSKLKHAWHNPRPPLGEEELKALTHRVATRYLDALDKLEDEYCIGSQAEAPPPRSALCVCGHTQADHLYGNGHCSEAPSGCYCRDFAC